MSKNIIEFFPFVLKTKESIEHQNKFLAKISLTGKINADAFSANLFEYTDKTIEKFEELKNELISALVEENYNKTKNELTQKSRLAIDVLKRNLFERTADVGFLSMDDEIINFIKSSNKNGLKLSIKHRLEEYVSKYSVYDDVMIFDTQGNLLVNINNKNIFSVSKDKILKDALKSEDFVEYYGHSDIFKTKNKSLLYAHKIVSDNQTIGVLCLSFKFQDEVKTIFDALSLDNEVLFFEDDSGVIATSKRAVVKEGSQAVLIKRGDGYVYNNKYLAFKSETQGYQGYIGLPWRAVAMATRIDESEPKISKTISLPKKLQSIIDEANELVDDLSDVIINGELTASKYRAYTLSPILDNLRNISDLFVENINISAKSLANIKTLGLLNSSKLAAIFAIDLMDRNLYERANDCRWWALNPVLINELKSKQPNSEAINQVLSKINSLYTVYTDIFVYDSSSTIVASSKQKSNIGLQIQSSVVNQVLQNSDTQNFFVSQFENSQFYDNKPTYIYHATILDGEKVVGGIGIVFDSEVEFYHVLKSSVIENVTGFSVYCDKDRRVVASTTDDIKPLDVIDIDQHFLKEKAVFQDFVSYNQKEYLLTVAPSKGYREYKVKDNYKNDIFVASFIEI